MAKLATTCLVKLSLISSTYTTAETSTDGGPSKITNSSWAWHPFLARASAHLFASQNTCFTLIWGIISSNNLQSNNEEEFAVLEEFLELIKSTMTFASSSTSKFCTPSWMANFKPSLSA